MFETAFGKGRMSKVGACGKMADPLDLESVRALVRERGQEIIEKYSAEGIGIGRATPGDPSYVIVVYLISERREIHEPIDFEGIPLKFEVTGKFRTQT